MAEFVLNRNHVIRSVHGHAVAFAKGQPTFVPDLLIPDALAVGAERVDSAQDAHMDVPVLPKVPQGAERTSELRAAVDALCERNAREDFTAQGVPTVKAVTDVVGFPVNKAEINIVWQARNEEKAAAE